MADLLSLKNAIVAGLVHSARIPMVPDSLARVIYDSLIDRIWKLLPSALQDSIGTAAKCIDPQHTEEVLHSLTVILHDHLPKLLPWLVHDDAVKVSQSVAQTLMAMSAPGTSAETFKIPEQAPL